MIDGILSFATKLAFLKGFPDKKHAGNFFAFVGNMLLLSVGQEQQDRQDGTPNFHLYEQHSLQIRLTLDVWLERREGGSCVVDFWFPQSSCSFTGGY